MDKHRIEEMDPEKRRALLQAGYAAFAKHGYKKTSTDDIVRAAGISKGLLYYYFGTKKGFYEYLYNELVRYMWQQLQAFQYLENEDFFAMMQRSQEMKFRLMLEYPQMMEFAMHAYFETDPAVAPVVQSRNAEVMQMAQLDVMAHVDKRPFKPEIDLSQALKLVTWTSEGYLKERVAKGAVDPRRLFDDFAPYMAMLRKTLYRDEYQASPYKKEAITKDKPAKSSKKTAPTRKTTDQDTAKQSKMYKKKANAKTGADT